MNSRRKEREALIANHDTEQMTALLKETMDQSPPDSNLPHQERENGSLPHGAVSISP
jgi:hypothetical protein